MQYNQAEQAQSVRIGNWFEELRLKKDTGIRFYPEPTVKQNTLLTQSRCITHSEQTSPKDYISVTHDTIRDPKINPNAIRVDSMGPRMRRFEASTKSKIEEDLAKQAAINFHESRKLDYSTSFKEAHSRGNFHASLRENDPHFRVPTKTTNYSTDEPITIYSHAVRAQEGQVNFPLSFVGSMNPFRKNLVFSADIEHDVLMTRTETYERPKPLPTIKEYKTLLSFRQKILDAVSHNLGSKTFPGSAVRFLVASLGAQIRDDLVPIQELEAVLTSLAPHVDFTHLERTALIAAYDLKNNGCISMFDFCGLFRRTPSPRRMELIGMFYTLLDPIHEGTVQTDAARSRAAAERTTNTTNIRSFFEFVEKFGGTFTLEDFYEFYVDVSSETESDEVFEELLRDTWGSL